MGILFFIWMGIFNVLVVAQFWGFANDLYSEEAGKRLFPLLAFGATFGSFSGSAVLEWLVKPFGLYKMMLIAGGFLGICIILAWIVHTRELKKARHPAVEISPQDESSQKEQERPLEKGGGFRLIFKKRYLLYIALFVMMLNFVNTNGEFIKDVIFTKVAEEAVETGTADGLNKEEYIGKIDAGWMKYFNLIAMFIQIFVVSRVFKWLGVRAAIFFLPIIALGGYFFIALGASFTLVYWIKAIENGTDYSLMNTTRHSLFLITSRQEKYKAQAAVKSFFHRSGDFLSATLVLIGTTFLVFKIENFAMVNFVLVLIWIFVGILIYREHKKLSGKRTEYQVE
jgi:AAA family ATP:ADP antiporter